MTPTTVRKVNENKISNNGNHSGRGAGKSAGWLPAWDGALYAANTSHHRRLDEWFLQNFPVRPTDRVLDIGCGSGDFSVVVADLLPAGQLVGIDPQDSLLEQARKVGRDNQTFAQLRAQDVAAAFAPKSFDAIFSRAVFHWIPGEDYPAIFAAVRELLKPGGWFRLECGGAGNINAILPFLTDVSQHHHGPPPPWTFSDPGTALDLLESAGFVLSGGGHPGGLDGYVNSVAQRRAFDRPALLGWMRSQCRQGFEVDMPVEHVDHFRAELEDRIDELQRADGTYDLTYVRLDALVYRAAE
jgi:SAM-dependent methyltransferase